MTDLDRQLRAYYDAAVRRVDPFAPGDLRPATSRPTRAWVIAATSAIAVLTIGAVTIFVASIGPNGMEPVGVATTLPSESSVAPAETAAPDDPPVLWTQVWFETAGDSTFAWNDNEIWRYSAGEWSPLAAAPAGSTWDLAYASGTLWAITGSGMQYLETDTWHHLDAPGLIQAWRIAADPGNGIVWVSTGKDLYRWDGTEMTKAGHPPNYPDADGEVGGGYVEDIAVTSDGSVWAAGLYGYVPWLGGLARYDDATGSWEVLRPLGGDGNVPAWLLAPTPDGDLWVILADWFEDWQGREAAGEPTAVLTLVHHDGATGEWSVYDEELPEGDLFAMASGGDVLWLAVGGEQRGIARFDGRTWTTYLEDIPIDDTVDDIAVAPDGTIWYTINGEIHRLEP